MKKSKAFTNGIVIGTFLILYFIIMYIATFLVKENFKAEYEEYLFNQAVTLAERMSQDSDYVIEQNKKEKGRELSYLNYMISINNQGMDEHQQISMAVYDTEGNIYTKTGNMFGNNQGMYQIEDYFTEKELEEIIRLQPNQEEADDDQSSSGDCYVRMFYCDGYLEPMGVELTRFGNGEVLWNWTNVLTGPDGYSNYDEERTGYIFLPYIDYGSIN